MSSAPDVDVRLPAFPEFLAALPQLKGEPVEGVYFLPAVNLAGQANAAVIAAPNKETADGVTALVRQVLARHGRPDAQTLPLPALSRSSAMPLDALEHQLSELGVPTHVEKAASLEDLAIPLEAGASVILLANRGELCDDAGAVETGEANGLALALAIGRDAQTDIIVACRLTAGGQEIEVEQTRLLRAWLDAGGWMLVTDTVA